MSEHAIIKHEEQSHVPAPATESAAIFQIIERAARDPNVDIDKMERLLMMQERVLERNAKAAFNAAFARMQPELPAVEKRGKSNNGLYGLWEDIQGEIQPVLARHGFALSFKTKVDAEAITITAILHHEEGHDDSTDLKLPADKSGSKNNVQAVGSSVSYGKRYAACALLNIRVKGEDDDAKAAGAGDTISEEQAEKLRALIEATNSDIERFCSYFKIDSIPDLPAAQFQRAVASLEKKKAK